MTDHESTAKRLWVHYLAMLAEAAGVSWDYDNGVEVEGIVEHIIAAAREPPTPPADPLVGTYTFTYEQLYDLLTETVTLAYEHIEKHGHSALSAAPAAAQEALEGLDAERELWAAGEVTKPSQILP